jgi:hypothetical protein
VIFRLFVKRSLLAPKDSRKRHKHLGLIVTAQQQNPTREFVVPKGKGKGKAKRDVYVQSGKSLAAAKAKITEAEARYSCAG